MSEQSLTAGSKIFTISTYDPPSTPIALKVRPSGTSQRPAPESRKSTPPQQDTELAELVKNRSRTPPVDQKILPWVTGIDADRFSAPDGMFGPYDSLPPTRVQSMHDVPQNPMQRGAHPFAYHAGGALPFSAIGPDQSVGSEEAVAGRHRPESEVLSRGAGMRAFAKPKDATPGAGLVGGQGMDTPPSGESPAMGTFGMIASQENLIQQPITKPNLTGRKPVPPFEAQLPAEPRPATPTTRPRGSAAGDATPRASQLPPVTPPGPHVHHVHPEFPFDIGEAARKQEAAMQEARAAALAQLQAARQAQESRAEDGETFKGPRLTYDTTTSGPSFGHILHRDGMPVSRHMSMQPEGPNVVQEAFFGPTPPPRPPMPLQGHDPTQGPSSIQQAFFGPPQPTHPPLPPGPMQQPMRPPPGRGSFFRIPFGVPMGMSIPRPLMLSRNSVGLGVGVGLPSGLAGLFGNSNLSMVQEGSEQPERKDTRSAYVETVLDEEEPTAPTHKTGSGTHRVPSAPSRDGARSATRAGSAGQPNPTTGQRIPSGSPSALPSHPPTLGRPVESPTVDSEPPAVPPKSPKRDTELPARALDSVIPAVGSSVPPAFSATAAPDIHLLSTQSGAMPTAQASRMPTQGSMTPALVRSPEEALSVAPNDPLALGSAFSFQPTGPQVVPETVPLARLQPRPIVSDVASLAESVAPTTATHVKRLVNDSKFHDEVLCQLLDAARLNLIGSEAKKALNRAAKARVAELRDLRGKGLLEDADVLLKSPRTSRKSQERKSRERHSKRRGGSGESMSKVEEEGQDQAPPAWAQDIVARLAAFDSRFAELEKVRSQDARQATVEEEEAPSQDVENNFIDELLFNTLQASALPPSMRGMQQMPLDFQLGPTMGTYGPPLMRSGMTPSDTPTRIAASVRSTVHEGQRRDVNGELISWGSEVEAPPVNANAPAPMTPVAPTIMIQAPTESNVEKSRSGVTQSRGTRTHRGTSVDLNGSREARNSLPDHPVAVPDPTQRSLPATPDDSIKSFRPSPPPNPVSMPLPPSKPPTVASNHQDQGRNLVSLEEVLMEDPRRTLPPLPTVPPPQSVKMAREQSHYGSLVHDRASQPSHARTAVPSQPVTTDPASNDKTSSAPQGGMSSLLPDSHTQTGYKTAVEQPIRTPPGRTRDRLHLVDPIGTNDPEATPWDMVSERLFSWAILWDDNTFINALEGLSLGHQVEETALSIFAMLTFKRMLRRNLSHTPPKRCDKLLIPPLIANTINQAVHSKEFPIAQKMLEDMWWPFLFKEPPRVIIALARHRNEPDQWTAHRYDLSSGSLRSYAVNHEDDSQLQDGRPFMWWHAIRLAWPQYKIPDPDTLSQRVEAVRTQAANKDDNSLVALGYARNLFVGFRPEHPFDSTSLRESIWTEVKRLLEKKRAGHLVVDMDSPHHVEDL